LGFIIKGAVVAIAAYILSEIFNKSTEEKTKNGLILIVIIGTAIGAWISCTNVVDSSFWSFILKAVIIIYTAIAVIGGVDKQ